MPGFWETMRRLMVGEAAFQPGDQKHLDEKDDWGDDAPVMDPERPLMTETPQDEALEQPVTDQFHTASGQKILPEISVGRCETHQSGTTFELWILIRNESPYDLMLDKIHLLGTSMPLGHFLKPSESREFRVFHGDMLKNGSYTNADITYKLVETGDYFQADFEIVYEAQGDGDFVVTELRLVRPIRDI